MPSRKTVELYYIKPKSDSPPVVNGKFVHLWACRKVHADLSRGNVVYVSGRYTAPTKAHREINIARAELVSVALIEAGMTFVCPHKNTALLEAYGCIGYEDYMDMDFEIIKRSNSICMIQDWQHSSGARTELRKAQEYDLGVIFATFQNMENYPCHPKSEVHIEPMDDVTYTFSVDPIKT